MTSPHRIRCGFDQRFATNSAKVVIAERAVFVSIKISKANGPSRSMRKTPGSGSQERPRVLNQRDLLELFHIPYRPNF